MEEVESARANKKGLRQLSKKDINSCFDDVPLSNQKYGIMGITPPDMLHVAGTGILKYMFNCVSDIIGPEGTKK